ncbi:TRIO, partial [Symbiodinium microadriaticum]
MEAMLWLQTPALEKPVSAVQAGAGFSSMSSQWAATAQLFDSSLQNSLCLTPSSCASTTRTAPFRTPTPPPRTRAGAMKGDGNSSDYSDDFEAPAPRPQPPGAPPPPGPTPQPAPRPPGPPVAPPTSSASLAPSLPAAPAASNLPPSMPPPLPPGAPAVPAAPAPARAPLMPEPPAPPTTSPAPPATVPQAPLAPSMPAAPLPPAAPVAPAPPTPPSLSFGTYAGEATRDDESLLRILGEVGPPPPPARSPTASRSPRSMGGTGKMPVLRKSSPLPGAVDTADLRVAAGHTACTRLHVRLLRVDMSAIPAARIRCPTSEGLANTDPGAGGFQRGRAPSPCHTWHRGLHRWATSESLATIWRGPQFFSRCMDRVPQKLREHILKDFTDWGFPTRSSAGETCRLLAAHLHRPFDLSPLLDVGSLARCPDSAAGVLLRREAGRFIPLREAAEYYGRAALLLTKAEMLQDHERNRAATGLQLERQHLLHEAREALGTALHGLPGRGRKKSKEGPGPERRAGSSSDPRMWYLLG